MTFHGALAKSSVGIIPSPLWGRWREATDECKPAFTLAEVLITLGIIGVVAAMTMPTLITKYQKHVAANRAKQVYSELSQVLQQARAKYGDMDSWEITSVGAEKYIVEFYKGLTVCKKPEDTQQYSNCGMAMSSDSPIYATTRGEGLSFTNANRQDSIFILVDTDGGKGKSLIGSDVFYFVMKNNRLTPFGWKDDITRDEIKNGYYSEVHKGTLACKAQSHNGGNNRHACTSLLMLDGWEMKDDYPW